MSRLRVLFWIAAAGVALGNAGCFISQYPSDRNYCMDVLLVQSEISGKCKANGGGFGCTISRLT